MLAIQVLGSLRSQLAVPELARMLENETEFYLLKEVLNALFQIDPPELIFLLEKAKVHPSSLIQRLAGEILEELTDDY